MFSQLSLSLMSAAMVTPSLTTSGAPFREPPPRTTLRPFGPSVTFTALATLSTPLARLFLAASPYKISLPSIVTAPDRLPTGARVRPGA
jgi:hypothetical protein